MEETADPERRCPACGAVAKSNAEWCWRCYERLLVPAPQVPAAPSPAETQTDESTGGVQKRPLTWPCAACGHENGIELEACEMCGTSFAALMRTDDKGSDVPPPAAFRRSLIYPGLGHAMVGRSLDGIARGAMFSMLVVMLVIVLLSGFATGFGHMALGLFVLVSLLVYLETAWEAYRIADGNPPLISSRTLTWITTGVILGSSALLAFTLAAAAKR